MKPFKILFLAILMFILVGSPAFAASLGDGIYDADGKLMSEVTLYAGSGDYLMNGGANQEASFRSPQSIVFLPDGRLIVADTRNQLIRSIADDTVSVYAGFTGLALDNYNLPEGALLDGVANEAVFNRPKGLALDAAGSIYVADADNHAIRKISVDGEVTTIAGDGIQGNQDGGNAQFNHPADLAVAADGTIYVTDTENHTIRQISKDGNVSTLNALSVRTVEQIEGVAWSAGDFQDGALSEAMFNEPSGIAIDAEGNLFVSDTGNQLIRYINLEAGTVTTVAGLLPEEGSIYEGEALHASGGFADGEASVAQFFAPKGLAVTNEGGLLIADSLNHAIRYLHEGTVSTIAGSLKQEPGDQDGINGSNLLDQPIDVTINRQGQIFIADSYNNSIKTLEIYQLPTSESEGIKITLGDQLVLFDVQPEIVNARAMVPVRAVGETFDYSVEFDNSHVLLSKGNKTVKLTVGSELMTVTTGDADSVEITLDVATYIKGDRTFVPLRFFSEEFGLDVQWHADSKTAILREK